MEARLNNYVEKNMTIKLKGSKKINILVQVIGESQRK